MRVFLWQVTISEVNIDYHELFRTIGYLSKVIITMNTSVSIIIPAKNESESLVRLLPHLTELYADAEIIVVDDGSTDQTEAVCLKNGVVRVHHPHSLGNGAAIKSGARRATGEILVFMDADGQHRPDDIPKLLEKLNEGYDMAVGARDRSSQASIGRLAANSLYNFIASWMTGQKVQDLTSGFRAVWANKFKQFLYLLPNGFSYPTTITMAFFRVGYPLSYVPITVDRREGKSHIHPLKDGVRFLLIIFRVGTLYSPLKLFFPVSFGFFSLGLANYFYTFYMAGRFTNMSALLFIVSVLVFMMGLISEQITNVVYQKGE